MTIGQKIKFFRKRAGLSQQQLELAIDASFGSISRIENGETNPMKETLNQIAEYLKLDFYARSYLMGINLHEISEDEISHVLTDLKPEIDQHFAPAYLCDFKWRLLYWNKLTTYVFNINDKEFIEKKPNLLELFFNPMNKFEMKFEKRDFLQIAEELLRQFYYECGFVEEKWLVELISKLETYSNFKDMYERISKENNFVKITDTDHPKVKSKWGLLNFDSIQSRYNEDHRFVVIKYYPTNPVTSVVLKSIQKLIP